MPAGGEPGAGRGGSCSPSSTRRVPAYTGFLGDKQFRKATAELRAIWAAGNAYWEQTEPWKAIKADAERPR